MHQVLEKIKNEPFFKQPNKMMGNLEKRNHNLYCKYHQDHGHTTEDCKSPWDHLDQLVREGKLKSYYIIPVVRGARQALSLKEIFLQDPSWELSMSFLLPRGEQGPTCPG